jgi:hypothetical protein
MHHDLASLRRKPHDHAACHPSRSFSTYPDLVSITPGLRARLWDPNRETLLRLFCGQTKQTTHTRPDLTTPSVEHAKPFTSSARMVSSFLPRSLTWPPPMHQLLVHDFIFLFLHHAARTWSLRPRGPLNQAYLSLHHLGVHLDIELPRLFFTAPTQTKPQPAPVILG